MRVYPIASVPAEEYRGVEGITIRWAIGQNVGAPNFYLRVIEVQPGASIALHQHDWEHEVYVLAGAGLARDAHGETPLEPGSCAYIAPNEPHAFENTGAEPLRFVCVIPKPRG